MDNRIWVYCDKCFKILLFEYTPNINQTCGFCGGRLLPYTSLKLGEYWDKWIIAKKKRMYDLEHYAELIKKTKNDR